MGIPRFYRYISERYPLINQPISDVSLLPTFDCFYLDMNGIIHNCTHTDSLTSDMNTLPLSAQLHNIFTYMDRLITHIIKPTQLVYIAIDGVAPRAKLNQQRSRRFRAGLDRVRALEQDQYRQITSDEEPTQERFDSNSITPGTCFLTDLSKHLIWFIRYKLKHDPLWQQLQVFFSGSEVPGEGEHKIVDFIRHRKMTVGYGPNTRHCMYGSDADLMLLGLMTHEPHFTLVREVVQWGKTSHTTLSIKKIQEEQWQLVHLSVLREYLMMEMRVVAPLDGERMLNDFILLTFLLGNDFIPHSPTLEINEDAIPLLLKVYRELLETHHGEYLTLDGRIVNIHLLQALFVQIGLMEEDILTTRAHVEEMKRKKHQKHQVNIQHTIEEEDDVPELISDSESEELSLLNAIEGKDVMEEALAREEEEHRILSGSKSFQETKWSYYERKFGISTPSQVNQVKKHYMEALVWVLEYYFQGPPCWGWFYPYHYSPMLSDLTDIVSIFNSISFQRQGPLLPFEQLMANLPGSSAHLVPEPYRFLMLSPLSPIISYYPKEFEIDMEGKRNAWEGINLLPFINVEILQAAIAQYCPPERLTAQERARNQLQPHALRIVYDAQNYETFPSTMPGYAAFPDIASCQTQMAPYCIPKSDPRFTSRLMEGVTLPMAGFPSLYTLEIASVRMDAINLNCFGMSSRKSTLVLKLPSPSIEIETILPLLKTTVLVNWPHLHQAQVVGVSTLHGIYRIQSDKSIPVFNGFNDSEKLEWIQYTQTERTRLLSGRGTPGSGGIDLNEILYLIHVVPLQGMIRNPMTGAIEKKFGKNEARVPYQLVVCNRTLEDPRFQEHEAMTLEKRFPIGSRALITAGRWLGCTGKIQNIIQDKQIEIQVVTIEQEPPFGYVISQQLIDIYYPFYIVSKRLGISTTIIGMLCGSIILKPNDYEIGLNLRYRKELYLPGYLRLISKDSEEQNLNVWEQGDIVKIIGSNSESIDQRSKGSSSVWECSERTIALLASYQQSFPDVIQRLETMEYAKGYSASQLFGTKDKQEIEKKSIAIVGWIERQAIGKKEHARHIPISSTHVSITAMHAMEAAGAIRAKEYESRKDSTTIAKVAPYELFRPNPLVNQDLTGMEVAKRATKNTIQPLLGDRVINICARGVPFGHRGTIVATHVSSKCVEVLFDQGFTGGEPLYGTISLDRGKLVPWNQLLCVSTPHDGRPTNNRERQPRTKTNRISKQPPPPKAAVSKEGFVVSENYRQHPKKQPHVPIPGPLPVPKPVEKTPTPKNMPPPPDPAKMTVLLKKWSRQNEGDTEDTNVSPSVAAFFTEAAETAPAQEIAPSVAALLNAAAPSYAPPLPATTASPLDELFPHLSDLQIQPPPPPRPLMVPPPPPPSASRLLNPHANTYIPPTSDFPPLDTTSKKKQSSKSRGKSTSTPQTNGVPKKQLLMPSQLKRGMKSTPQ